MAASTSILGPNAGNMAGTDAAPHCFADLHLDEIIATVTAGHDDGDLASIFYAPLHDLAAVHYRQQVFRDLENDEIRIPIRNFVDGMRTVRGRLHVAQNVWHRLQRQGWLIDAVETYCRTTAQLQNDLAHIGPASQGLSGFAEYVAHYVGSEGFGQLVAETEAVRAELRSARYVVHIQGLRVHVEKFDDQSDYSSGIAESFERFATEVSKDYHIPFSDYNDMNHVEEQILEGVAKLHPEAFARLNDFCCKHKKFIDPTVSRFEREVQFYLTYLAFIGRFSAGGLRFGYPEVTEEPGIVNAEGAFDLALANKSAEVQNCPVTNSFHLSEGERILVVTGPNQGGKTTFARTIGQCVYLASLGCPIPATKARLSLPDQIYTHFERQEDVATLHGKLDDELVRIHDILSRATDLSVIVMNESFSSTTLNDALLIGSEVLKRIIKLGCVAVYVSFLDELSKLHPACVSMVGEIAGEDPTQRTFKFTRRPADGLAYAAALADKYGLSHHVLRQRIGR